MSPMIMNVAVPLLKHSPRFGQAASSQTVCSLAVRRMSLMRATSGVPCDLARIQVGLRSGAVVASILIGMRAIFSAPRSFSPWTMGLTAGGSPGAAELGGIELIAADRKSVVVGKGWADRGDAGG